MGIRDRIRDALAGDQPPGPLPARASSKQIAQHQAQKERAAQASRNRAKAHKEGLAKKGSEARWPF